MSTTPTTINVSAQKATMGVLLSALVKGIDTELASMDSIEFDGSSHKRTDLLASIQAVLDAISSVKATRTALSKAVASQKVAIGEGRLLRAGMKRYLQAKYGPTSPKLQEFGYAPARTPKTPLKSKTEAKAKAAATRVARGTKGKKAKAAIHGSLPVAPASISASPAGGTATRS